MAVKDIYQPFLREYQGLLLPVAGFPAVNDQGEVAGGFVRLFPRDGLTKERLDPEQETMRNWLRFGAINQGTKYDPVSGEMPGAIPHEIDQLTGKGIELEQSPGYETTYNAHDTTALWLKVFEEYTIRYDDIDLAIKLKGNILKASDYIFSNLNQDYLFSIDPRRCGANKFALHVTYWKDSQVPKRDDGKFVYPAVITLAHIQNRAGLESTAFLLNALPEEDKNFQTRAISLKAKKYSEKMRQALITHLFDPIRKTFYVAVDALGTIAGETTDPLHGLAYLKPGDLLRHQLRGILESASALVTEAGLRAASPELAATMQIKYHADNVWPPDQAIINEGVRAHLPWADRKGWKEEAKLLAEIELLTLRVRKFLRRGIPANQGHYPEILNVGSGRVIWGGCNPILWSVATEEKFNSLYGSASEIAA